jgi:predicted GTPase
MAERSGVTERVVIMGAAGRDFHNFNMLYRDDPRTRVVAFTAAQIPGIAGRRYPAALAGRAYPDGIAIRDEDELESVCRAEAATTVMFAYSDVPYATVLHAASRAAAAGCDFVLAGPERTMLRATKPVVAVCAVRTGCGKSQTTRYLARHLVDLGLRPAVLRHPMPYGDLAAQAVQRFGNRADLDDADCTIEEREEYEPYLELGLPVFAGVDYGRILERAEREADIVLWDGGNNDFPFVRPNLHIVLADALRPGHETAYWPGEVNLRLADIVVLAKSDAAASDDVATVRRNVAAANPNAVIVPGASPVRLDDPAAVRGRRVLVVDDGPTLTHGGMPYGAGHVAATAVGAAEIVDPRPFAVPAIAALYDRYPHIGPVLPAMGYSPDQRRELAATINASGADIVVAGTPIDLARDLALDLPVVRARYEYADAGEPALWPLVETFLGNRNLLCEE